MYELRTFNVKEKEEKIVDIFSKSVDSDVQ